MEPMNILFLDDDENRISTVEYYIPCVKIARSASECIHILDDTSKLEYTLISLDHDLGGHIFVNSEEKNTGMEIVRWLYTHPVNCSLFVVHSFNAIGAENMAMGLKKLKYSVERILFNKQFYEQIGIICNLNI